MGSNEVATDDGSTSPRTNGQPARRILRWEVVQALLDLYQRPRYLEVGVQKGLTFHKLAAHYQVAVDPRFRFDWKAEQAKREGRAEYRQVTSDEYFGSVVEPDQLFDVIFLDGLHTFEQTLRDFTNALVHLAPGGVILIDDVRPRSYHASLPAAEDYQAVRGYMRDRSSAWMGDVYKLVWFIDTFYQSLSYATVADNHGQSIVWRQRRPAVTERGVAEIGAMAFDQFVRSRGTLRSRPLVDIIDGLVRDGLAGDKAAVATRESAADDLREAVN